MSMVSTEETDDSQERFLGDTSKDMAEREENVEQGPRKESSSSSSEAYTNAASDQNTTDQTRSFSLQGQQEVFENGATSTQQFSTPHSQEAGVSLTNSASEGTSEHFIPTLVKSSQQDIQSLNPEQNMGLMHSNHSSVPSENVINTEPDSSSILQNQLSVPSTEIHAEDLVPSQTMGMMNHGYVFQMNQPIRNAYGIINTYHLPISNLPPEFRLESSSRLQLPQVHQQGSDQTTPESGDGLLSFTRTQLTNWPPQNQITMRDPSTAVGTQEIQFQGLLNHVTGPSTFYPSAGTSTHIHVPNMPIQPGMIPYGTGQFLPSHFEGVSASNQNKQGMQGNLVNSNQYEAGESSMRSPKMKIPWQNNNNNMPLSPNLQLGSWLSPVQDSQGHNIISPSQNSRLRSLRNTVYDPLYEEMGLPIDPHLRIFVARRDTGNIEDQ